MQKVYALQDSKANAFLQPFHSDNAEVAIRACKRALREPGNPVSDYPFDFTLYEIAEFDQQTGVITPLRQFNCIGNLGSFAPAAAGASTPAADAA